MACCQLDLANEFFGLPIEPSGGGSLQRGEWFGLGAGLTHDIAGVSVVVSQPFPNNGRNVVRITVGGRDFILPWRATVGVLPNLDAARFRTAEFLVIRDVKSSSPFPTNEWSFLVIDLRPGTHCHDLVILGPYTVPSINEINFCPSGNGQLAMIWYGSIPNVVAGRDAYVVRTTVDPNMQPTLLTALDPNATGILGCEVRTVDRTITIFDRANRQGNSISRITNQPLNNSRNLASPYVYSPGMVRLTPQSVRMDASETTESFQIENVGGDFLEVVSVVPGNAAVSATPSGPLPRCIWPGETISVVLTRASNAAANVVVTVGTSPAAAPASTGVVNVQMLAKAVAPSQPAATVRPQALSWRVGGYQRMSIVITNTSTGNANVDVHTAKSAASSGFDWAEVVRRPLLRGQPLTVEVAPRNTGPDQDTLTVEAFDSASGAALAGFPVPVLLTKNVPVKVPVGTLRITALLADAHGSDIAPEGEFIEIINTTNAPLDLEGCRITHETRPAGVERELVRFSATAFGSDALLAPFSTANRPLRVMTRARALNESQNDRLRYYCGKKGPVWNNSGDIARIYNDAGQLVTSWAYVPTYPAPGTSLPPGTVVSPPPAKRRVATRRVFVNARSDWTSVFNVEDGDVVRIRNVTGRVTLGGFLGAAGDSGPEGRINDPAPSGPQRPDPFGPEVFFPVPGFPKYGLVGQIGELRSDGSIRVVVQPFFVGASSTVTVTIPENNGPLMLFLGVNDDLLTDNGGFFDCAADLSR